ncbi:MAG: hypothetical protein AAF558_13450 [Verrucomicrobiota bacterium]
MDSEEAAYSIIDVIALNPSEAGLSFIKSCLSQQPNTRLKRRLIETLRVYKDGEVLELLRTLEANSPKEELALIRAQIAAIAALSSNQ